MAPLSGLKFAQYQHPAYVAWSPIWRKLADAYEGTGGFATGTYLIPHPREWQDYNAATPSKPTKKLLERRTLARYENWPRRLIKTFADSLFRAQPVRQVNGEADGTTPLEQWWLDVDGRETDIDDFWAETWRAAGVFGHVFLMLDRPSGEAATAADTRAPILRAYTPLDATDWTEDHGELTSIKFLEAAPRTNIADPYAATDIRVRVVTADEWVLYDQAGRELERGEHGMGILPVVPLYADRRTLAPMIGAAVIGDPQTYIDLYNLISEHRELLRKQTFAILNIPLGPDGDVEKAKALLGTVISTDNVLFSALEAQWLSPSLENTTAYRLERQDLLRTIFRLVGLQWESDSRDAESEGSLKLKREDMNTALAGFADNLEKADYKLAELWYRATLGADAGARAYAQAEVEIRYPDTFDVTPFDELLLEAQAALSLGMGLTFKKELRKRLVQKFLPDLAATAMQTITDEIDAQADEPEPGAVLRAALAARAQPATAKPDADADEDEEAEA